MGPALPTPQGLPLGGRAVHAPPDVQRKAAPGQKPLRPQLAPGKAMIEVRLHYMTLPGTELLDMK